MANGIKVGNIEPYKKGDTFTPTSNAVYVGYVAYTGGVHLSIPLDKPCAVSGASISLNQTQLGFTTIDGICMLSNPIVSDITVNGGCVNFTVTGTTSITLTQYTPIAMGIDATITFT